MSTIQAPAIIDQPVMPENYYGMSMAVSNIYKGTVVYLGNNRNAEKLQVTDISFHDEMWYLTVVDVNQNQFTVRYQTNARVQVASF
jgi:hypothetical protein